MTAKQYVGRAVGNMVQSSWLKPYTGVAISTGETDSNGAAIAYVAGSNNGGNGRILEISNPWGTQRMADTILNKINGYVYKPFSATDAFMPDLTELGDTVSIGPLYGLVAEQDIEFDGLMVSDVKSPGQDETHNEFGNYRSSSQRQFSREINGLKSEFIVGLDRIRLGVADSTRGLSASIDIALSGITSTVTDAMNGMQSTISQTANSIRACITDSENRLTNEFNMTAAGFTATVTDQVNQLRTDIRVCAGQIVVALNEEANGLSAAMCLSAACITTVVQNAEAGIESKITQEAGTIRTQVKNQAEGTQSVITQEASAIKACITDSTNNTRACITATAACIQSSLTDTKNSISSSWTQTAGCLSAILDDKLKGLSTSITATAAGISLTSTGLSAANQRIDKTLTFDAYYGLSIMGNHQAIYIDESRIAWGVGYGSMDYRLSQINSNVISANNYANTAYWNAYYASQAAGRADTNAQQAQTDAQTAMAIAAAVCVPGYIQSTYINANAVISPYGGFTRLELRGGALKLMDPLGWQTFGWMGAMTGDEGSGYTDGIGLVASSTNYLIATPRTYGDNYGGVRMQGGSIGSIYVVNDRPYASGYDSSGQAKYAVNLLDAAGGGGVAVFG